jgi:acetyl-CoA acetyltransferase
MRDWAIVGFAETKIVERSARDAWELGGEILETLLDRTAFEKAEIDGLILSSSITGAGNPFWSQNTAEYLGLQLDFCQTVDIGGCSPVGALARATAAIDAGLCSTVMLLYADTAIAENNARMRSFGGEWTSPVCLLGAAGLVRPAVAAIRIPVRARLSRARQARRDTAQPRDPQRKCL